MARALCQSFCIVHNKRPELIKPNKSYQNSDDLISTNSVEATNVKFEQHQKKKKKKKREKKKNVVVVQQRTKILKDITLC